MRTRAGGPRVAADDELLPFAAFQLQPITRAAGAVTAVGALGDDPFQVVCRGGAIEVFAAFRDVFGVRDHAAFRHEHRQALFPLDQWQGAQVPAGGLQAVEEEAANRRGPRRLFDVVAAAQVHAPLQALEAGPAVFVHGDHLAVDHEVGGGGLAQRVDDLGVARRHVVALAAKEGYRGVTAPGEHADAVVLDLEEPFRVRERDRAGGGEHRSRLARTPCCGRLETLHRPVEARQPRARVLAFGHRKAGKDGGGPRLHGFRAGLVPVLAEQ